jgi:hypothetical protein
MATVAEMQAQLAQLMAGRAAAEKMVRIGQNVVEMKPDAELAHAIADLERRIAQAEGTLVRTISITVDRFGGSRGC